MNKCPLCDSSSNSKKIGHNKAFNLDIMYCSKCKLGYFLGNDSSAKKRLAAFYKRNYWHPSSGTRENRTLVDKLRRSAIKLGVPPLIAVSHFKMMRKYQPSLGKKLIDIGCGQGDAIRFFKSKGYRVSGIESDKINVKKINSLLGEGICVAGDAENLSLKEEYDVIYLCHVLEHFVSPLAFLKKARRHLGKHGLIFLEVPNCENEGMMTISLGMESHMYHFTHESIRKLFKKAGYKIIVSGTYSDASPHQFISFFLALLRISSYKKAKSKSGQKIILIAGN